MLLLFYFCCCLCTLFVRCRWKGRWRGTQRKCPQVHILRNRVRRSAAYWPLTDLSSWGFLKRMFQLCKQEKSVSRSRGLTAEGEPEGMNRRYEIIYTEIPTDRTVSRYSKGYLSQSDSESGWWVPRGGAGGFRWSLAVNLPSKKQRRKALNMDSQCGKEEISSIVKVFRRSKSESFVSLFLSLSLSHTHIHTQSQFRTFRVIKELCIFL